MASRAHDKKIDLLQNTAPASRSVGCTLRGSSYGAVTRPQTNRWTEEQRLVLILLAYAYETCIWGDITRIFNARFAEELPTPAGLTQSALKFQLHDLKVKTGVNGKNWQSFTSPNPGSCTQTSIEQQASRLGIRLTGPPISGAHLTTSASLPVRTLKRKIEIHEPHHDVSNRRCSTDFLSVCEEDTSEFSDDSAIQNTCTPARPSKSGLLSPPSTKKVKSNPLQLDLRDKVIDFTSCETDSDDSDDQSPPSPQRSKDSRTIRQPLQKPRIARLAFRAYNTDSQGINSAQGFRAGAFVDKAIPPPPDPTSSTYREEAIRHVAPRHLITGTTPFISVTRSLLRCLHRALRISLGTVAVIDLAILDRMGIVQSATALKLQVNHPYYPSGEYLVYGAIPQAAVISTFDASNLLKLWPQLPGDMDAFQVNNLQDTQRLGQARRKISRNRLPISYSSGKAVGHLARLLDIPLSFLDSAVYAIGTDWKFQGCGRRGWHQNEVFKAGVELGYGSSQSASVGRISCGDDAETGQVKVEHDNTEDPFASDAGSGPGRYSNLSTSGFENFLMELEEMAVSSDPAHDGSPTTSDRCGLRQVDLERQCSQHDDVVTTTQEKEKDYAHSWTGM